MCEFLYIVQMQCENGNQPRPIVEQNGGKSGEEKRKERHAYILSNEDRILDS